MDNTNSKYNYNGPTILHILMVSVNPNTRVGIAGFKGKIRVAKMGLFNHNVKDLLTDIALNHNLIVKQGFTHNNVIMDTFNTLLTSKNVEINAYIQHHKDAWEEGKSFTLDGILVNTINNCNNMVHKKLWNKADPKNGKLLALTTELEDLNEEV